MSKNEGATPKEPLLVTTAEAARLLSVSTSEIRLLVRKGLLTHRKLGQTKWLITMKSIRAFADPSNEGRNRL